MICMNCINNLNNSKNCESCERCESCVKVEYLELDVRNEKLKLEQFQEQLRKQMKLTKEVAQDVIDHPEKYEEDDLFALVKKFVRICNRNGI